MYVSALPLVRIVSPVRAGTVKSVLSTPLTFSLKMACQINVSALVGVVAGLKRLKLVAVGAVVSMATSALNPREPAELGEARVRVALLVAASWIVPPLRVSALVLV